MVPFREQFRLNDEDLLEATRATRADFGGQAFPDEEIAITAIFLWFVQAAKAHGEYLTEYRYFLYALCAPLRKDAELRRTGIDQLTSTLAQHQDAILHLFSAILGR